MRMKRQKNPIITKLLGLFFRRTLSVFLCVSLTNSFSASFEVADENKLLPAKKSSQGLKLSLPIHCILGKYCHILAYVDVMPGPEYQDFRGGRQTYDGHDGTDFAIADEVAMKHGVPVKAAAPGAVIFVREGVADKRIENEAQALRISPLGCGNAVVIEHTDQWRTHYCHLRRGSVAVKQGMRVEAGAILGLVGLSGLTSFPHLHFGVLHKGKQVDPFTGSLVHQKPDSLNQPLWADSLDYSQVGLVSAGFTDRDLDISDVWQGVAATKSLNVEASAIVFWLHPFGVLAGDVEYLRLTSPDGKTVVEIKKIIKSSNRINRVTSVLHRRQAGRPMPAGMWQGEYQLHRQGKVMLDIKRSIEVTNT